MKSFLKSTRVSVVMPTYNHRAYIGSAIESVLAQTLQEWQLIVVDDGSSDGTSEIVERYSDPRIALVRQPNVGIWRLKEVYNKGLQRCTGEFVAVLEGDDLWPTDKLQLQCDALACSNAVVCYGHCGRIDRNGIPIHKRKSSNSAACQLVSADDALRGFLLGDMTVMPVTAMIRRKALLEIGGFQQPKYYPAVEHPTWLALARAGSFLCLNETLGYWRCHGGQTTHRLGMRLSSGIGRQNLLFFGSLSKDSQRRLRVSKEELRQYRRYLLARGAFYAARYKMAAQSGVGVQRNLRWAIRLGDRRTRLKARVALLALRMQLDPERVIGFLGGTRYARSAIV